jgi:hypothetical protein
VGTPPIKKGMMKQGEMNRQREEEKNKGREKGIED